MNGKHYCPHVGLFQMLPDVSDKRELFHEQKHINEM